MERSELLEKVIQGYAPYYDIERAEDEQDLLRGTAAYHEHGSGYLLSKKAVLYTADKHEYVWFFSVPVLTKELFQNCLDRVLAEGMPKVDPKPGHMSTNLVAIFLCDEAEDEAAAAAKKCRIRKSFQFSLRGWMEVQTVVVDLRRDAVTQNACAGNTAKFLKNLLHPQMERKKNHFFKIK